MFQEFLHQNNLMKLQVHFCNFSSFKRSSQEVVLDGFVSLFPKHSKSLSELEQKLTDAFATASTTSKYNKSSTTISIRLQLGSDTKIINSIINAYKNYTKITPIPKIG